MFIALESHNTFFKIYLFERKYIILEFIFFNIQDLQSRFIFIIIH